MFDTAAGDERDRALLPTWGSLAIFFPNPQPDGFPSPATAALLEALHERLCALLERERLGRLVGVITTDGRRELIIYAAAPDDLRQAARTLQGEYPALELQLTLMEDHDWEVFRQFVPVRSQGLNPPGLCSGGRARS